MLFSVFVLNTMEMNAQKKNELQQDLTAQQQGLVKISALTAIGNLEKLRIFMHEGLDAGFSINEIKEALVQLYAYCGFPRSLNGINSFMNVVSERKAKGIIDKEGKEIMLNNNSSDKYEQGRNVLEILTKVKQGKPAPGFGEFAPRIDAFLKEHLFADVFQSDVLNYQQRELVTISALASMQGVESQLQSHVNIGRNTGLTDNQLLQITQLIERVVNNTQANTLRKILKQPVVPIVATDMMVRISEIEIYPEYIEEYNTILKNEAAVSVDVEPGVIAIFPIYPKETPTEIKIVEIYAGKAAYQAHLQTPHFQHYKTNTLKMVKSLKLIDVETHDKEAMLNIFRKLN